MIKSGNFAIKGKKGMVALFMAIIINMILAFALVGFTDNNIRYISTARSYEDKVKAKYLALSGVRFSVLLLQIQKRMIDPVNNQFKMNFQIWQQVPLSSELLSMIYDKDSTFFKSMLGMDDDEGEAGNEKDEKHDDKKGEKSVKEIEKEVKDIKNTENKEIKFENKFKFQGDFFAEITDENKKYNVNFFKQPRIYKSKINVIRQNLLALFSLPEYKEFFESPRENDTVIPPEEVVASIEDWVDSDDVRSGVNGGAEDDRYQYLKHKYRNKNDKLTSFQELYMIYGIDDDFMANFGDALTVYGKNEININTCDESVIRGIILGIVKEIPPSYLEPYSPEMAALVSDILEYRTLSPFSNSEEFYNLLKRVDGLKIDNIKKLKFKLTTNSNIFKIVGYGSVNEAISKITVVIDTSNPDKQYLYYREE